MCKCYNYLCYLILIKNFIKQTMSKKKIQNTLYNPRTLLLYRSKKIKIEVIDSSVISNKFELRLTVPGPSTPKMSIETKVTNKAIRFIAFYCFPIHERILTTFSIYLVLPLLLSPYIFGLGTWEVGYKESFGKFLSV